jgi:hypothetical protein
MQPMISFKLKKVDKVHRVFIHVEMNDVDPFDVILYHCLAEPKNWADGCFKDHDRNHDNRLRQKVLNRVRAELLDFITNHFNQMNSFPTMGHVWDFVSDKCYHFNRRHLKRKINLLRNESLIKLIETYIYVPTQLPSGFRKKRLSHHFVDRYKNLLMSIWAFESERNIRIGRNQIQDMEILFDLFDFILCECNYTNDEAKSEMKLLCYFLKLLHENHILDLNPHYQHSTSIMLMTFR